MNSVAESPLRASPPPRGACVPLPRLVKMDVLGGGFCNSKVGIWRNDLGSDGHGELARDGAGPRWHGHDFVRASSIGSRRMTKPRGGDWSISYSPLVFSWCRRSGLNSADSSDVMQEVFAAVVASITRFRRERSSDTFRGWLRVIARNKIHLHFRNEANQPHATGGTDAQIRIQGWAAPVARRERSVNGRRHGRVLRSAPLGGGVGSQRHPRADLAGVLAVRGRATFHR